ncbi:NADP-dependent oxidoreductase [Hafnia paralvei]|jgi:NADPH-dependent curcumin reductase|uniref:NADP-dependent oxidoreductase n=1 Tax=Hafnia paralvei TaxID=546367 RepID=UPI0014194C35|nr:NADP-dependent oxidoreductase [Hafnia paralvei]MBW2956106.1 NADP-dependent oxidoreductase [Hafnia paralvei]MCE9880858.1 NADP-dependent oxidoreductase [Hafnia paralvei]MCE9908268.1 NADP-dependent oxidoreductase [Hafnia paralvei]MCE9913587.1 NADP-dependent oxidoreductase [Hafnia paralvei]MCK2179161.1 NADP-dependent oxidoreductase [Hafnia paralvei]
MSISSRINRRYVLAQRPQGMPSDQDFRLEKVAQPEPEQGQVLLRTLYLSLDPYVRGRLDDVPSYSPPLAIGDVICGGTVCRVEQSLHPDYQAGDLVLAYTGWQDYALSDGEGLQKLDANMAHPSYALGLLGMPGFTGYMGLTDIGNPQVGETVVVAAATGAVGSVVGQVAKLRGCRTVGIAGGVEKCRYAVEKLGFDACIDHRAADFAHQLKQACDKGIDVYYENVGGAVFDAVLPLLNTKARIPVCGMISQYNGHHSDHQQDRLPLLMSTILKKRMRVEGFIISQDYGDRYPEFYAQMSTWLAQGKIVFKEDIVDGLENSITAFQGLLSGKNFGKLIIKVAE